jgi:threo-3-hydroxy-L-aspartate ammonia-lyase
MKKDELSREAPTLAGVRAAAARLAGVANLTPVATSRRLNELTGASVFLKCENLQRAGAFKFRGAFNAVSRLTDEERGRGVVTYSSGNHAQAIALVGRLTGTRVRVVMPATAPAMKREATSGYGAEVVLYDPANQLREEVADRIQSETGSVLIPPFDHPDVVAGQGTAALELLSQVGPLDILLVPCGGGGLLAGSALAASEGGGCRVMGVEPELADDATRTFRSGSIQTVRNPPTIADGLRTQSLGGVTWPVIREHVAGMVTVSEMEIVEAMRFLLLRMKLLAEPSGAVALAALLADPEIGRGRRVGVIVSGGNVDAGTLCGLLTAAPYSPGAV